LLVYFIMYGKLIALERKIFDAILKHPKVYRRYDGVLSLFDDTCYSVECNNYLLANSITTDHIAYLCLCFSFDYNDYDRIGGLDTYTWIEDDEYIVRNEFYIFMNNILSTQGCTFYSI
jgi:hypothetical protein